MVSIRNIAEKTGSIFSKNPNELSGFNFFQLDGWGTQPAQGLCERGGRRARSQAWPIRRAMLNMVKESGSDKSMVLLRRVSYAHGFQDLWYLGGDVLA